jgi:hypothetical protein
METGKIHVTLYTIPQAACDSEKMNWYDVASLVKNQISTTFGEAVSFEHIEFMSKGWFQSAEAQLLLEKGEVNFPFVLVDNEVASADKKVNLSRIRRFIQSKLQLSV